MSNQTQRIGFACCDGVLPFHSPDCPTQQSVKAEESVKATPLTELDALLSRVREMRYNPAYADRNAVAYDCYRMFEELATRYKEECASRDRYDTKLAASQAERNMLAEYVAKDQCYCAGMYRCDECNKDWRSSAGPKGHESMACEHGFRTPVSYDECERCAALSAPRIAEERLASIDKLASETSVSVWITAKFEHKLAESQAERDLLAEALQFVREFLVRLEDGLPESDPLTAARRRFHGPLHLKINAALSAPPTAQRLAAMQELREAIRKLDRNDGSSIMGVFAAAEKVWPK